MLTVYGNKFKKCISEASDLEKVTTALFKKMFWFQGSHQQMDTFRQFRPNSPCCWGYSFSTANRNVSQQLLLLMFRTTYLVCLHRQTSSYLPVFCCNQLYKNNDQIKQYWSFNRKIYKVFKRKKKFHLEWTQNRKQYVHIICQNWEKTH